MHFNSYVNSILGGRNFTLMDADKGGNGGGGEEQQQTDNTETETDAGNPEGKETQTGQKGTQKTFTQEEVNNFVTKESRKQQEKLFKQLGVEDFNSAKEGLKKYQEMIDAQKTDHQKAQERVETLEKQLAETNAQNELISFKNAALSNKVKPDSVDDVILLAKPMISEEVDSVAAISKVLEKYPNFKEEAIENGNEQTQKPSFTQGEHTKKDAKVTDKENWQTAFKW